MTGERTELPLRLYDTDAGVVVGCLCSAEASQMTPPGSGALRALPDLSTAGLLRMVIHAKRCVVGQNLALARRPRAGAR